MPTDLQIIKTIQDVRNLLSLGHKGDDPLQRLWAKHRRDDLSDPGPLVIHYGIEYAKRTPKKIGENNLILTFNDFSTDELIKINHGITHRHEKPRDESAPIVIIKFKGNYHSIDGARRIRHWHLTGNKGPHKACVLVIDE